MLQVDIRKGVNLIDENNYILLVVQGHYKLLEVKDLSKVKLIYIYRQRRILKFI